MIEAIRVASARLGLAILVSDDVLLLAPQPLFWRHFEQSSEFSDRDPHPLDRYSKHVINALGEEFGLDAVYPSDGPPFAPFIDWALKAEGVYLAPIGLLVHVEFGLWISFRGALKLAGAPKRSSVDPCENCARPCLNACPVEAFSHGEYDVERCRGYLQSGSVDCWQGCLARRACPAAKIERSVEQNTFHMKAFAS